MRFYLDVKSVKLFLDINMFIKFGFILLFVVVNKRWGEIVEFLFDMGVDLSVKEVVGCMVVCLVVLRCEEMLLLV